MVLIEKFPRSQRLANKWHPIAQMNSFLHIACDDADGRFVPSLGGLDVFQSGMLANSICMSFCRHKAD